MLIYSKFVSNVRKLFGTFANIPSDSDTELTYKDESGAITPVVGDTYVDNKSSNGIQRMKRLSDNKVVNVYLGDTCIIGDGVVVPVLQSIAVKTNPTKMIYRRQQPLTMEGLVIEATYSDSSKVDIPYGTEGLTYAPVEGTLVSGEQLVIIRYGGKECRMRVQYEIPTGITVTTPPTKVNYQAGESLDMDGIVVKANYPSTAQEDVTDACSYNPAEGTMITQDTDVTITYSGTYTTTQHVSCAI